LWGAYVRASGSGAGCGEHWPLCNGVVVPRAPRLETLIELTHRTTTGLEGLLVIALVVFAWRTFPKGHLVRKAAMGSFALIIVEGLLGAGLVKLGLVAGNQSPARGVAMALHLVTTFILIAALSLTAFWSYFDKPISLKGQGSVGALTSIGLIALMLLGVTGAITALGDTLFPSSSVAEGMRQDLSPTAHLFIRLRVWHPILAMLTGAFVTVTSLFVSASRPSPLVRRFSSALIGLFVAQLLVGTLNLVLLVPIWTQILHLLLADLVWTAFILLTTAALSESAAPKPATESAVLPAQS
jgi:heme A synthase